MKLIKNELVVTIDCDDTLVMHDIDVHTTRLLTLDYYGTPKKVRVHEAHVELLKSYKARGFEVIVWSNNGYEWANQIVSKLELGSYVDHVMTKPCKHVDDKSDVESLVGLRVYISNPEHQ